MHEHSMHEHHVCSLIYSYWNKSENLIISKDAAAAENEIYNFIWQYEKERAGASF